MSTNKALIADSIILAVVYLMLLVMLWLTYKVYKITLFQDKVLLMMLIFLDITLMSKLKCASYYRSHNL